MPVRHEEEALVLLLQRVPVLQRAQPIAKMEQAARLHPAEYPFLTRCHAITPVFLQDAERARRPRPRFASVLRSLRPCWTALVSILSRWSISPEISMDRFSFHRHRTRQSSGTNLPCLT